MNIFELKVLICDDSLLVRKKLRDALEVAGFSQVLEAGDGNEAIEICKGEKPDVVLLDIIMPKKNGLEAIQEIKEINENTLVIMASSVGTQSNLIQSLKLGASNFIQKPITVDAVINAIQITLQERGNS
jgi:two-component system chemotaxis response regulator CheY